MNSWFKFLLAAFVFPGLWTLGAGPGFAVTSVTTQNNLIILELDRDEVSPANPFDLEGKTIRFRPSGAGRYSVQTLPLQWRSDLGKVLRKVPSHRVKLGKFRFPFSGKKWDKLYVGIDGNITFGADQSGFVDPRGEFTQLWYRFGTPEIVMRVFGDWMIAKVPIISPLFRSFAHPVTDPKKVNRRYVKELSDRVVITWEVSETYGGGGFIRKPKMNRFQAVLYRDGRIDFSYKTIFVKDGIVGIFPTDFPERKVAVLADGPDGPELPGHLDIETVEVFLAGNSNLRFTFNLTGQTLPEGDRNLRNISYLIQVDLGTPFDPDDTRFFITGTSEKTYAAFGRQVVNLPPVDIAAKSLSFLVPLEMLEGKTRFTVSGNSFDNSDSVVDSTDAMAITLPDFPPPVIDISKAGNSDPPRHVAYEAFQYPSILLHITEKTCAVIEALGDQFNFLALYSDFRLDKQGTGATSMGRISKNVTGIGDSGGDFSSAFCTDGTLQSGQNLQYIGSPSNAPKDKYIGPAGLLSHELGHRWLATGRAIVKGEPVDYGDGSGHYSDALHTPAAFPLNKVSVPSPMGGNVWRDNRDGTFTLQSSPKAKAKTYSQLDLYLMGFLPKRKVRDYFFIQDLEFIPSRKDNLAKGKRIDISIEDHIAVYGKRRPSFKHSQKVFNIGYVGFVQHGQAPSSKLLKRMAGIRKAFSKYWRKATGGVSRMKSVVRAN